jgi:hypothetical protein
MRMLMPAISPQIGTSPRAFAHYCRDASADTAWARRYPRALDADSPTTYFPHGRFRRRVRLVAPDANTVLGGLEDDQHYFTVRVEHDGAHVNAITSQSVRAPWTTCPAAGSQLQALVRTPLSDRCLVVAGRTQSDQHCTHQLDVATLAVAHAARVTAGGASRRQYDIEVPFGLLDGQRHTVTLTRDGEALLAWELEGARVVAPTPWSEAEGGFARWADATFDADTAEAAIVLKRACSIGMSRGMDLDSYPTLADMPGLSPVCWSMQPERAPVAFRNRGLIRDYDARPETMLAEGPE